MNSLHLFAGIGGGILADKILGNTIVGAVEIEPYCRAVLKQRQEEGYLEPFPIFEDIRTFNGNEIRRRIDLVCGGFPCQDISTAGRGQGIEGTKSRLFYELIRVCRNIKPRYIFLENSPAITGRGLGTCLNEIAEVGYDAEWTCLSAGECGAPHLRNRWWCLCKMSDSDSLGELQPQRIVEDLRRRFSNLGSENFGTVQGRSGETWETSQRSRWWCLCQRIGEEVSDAETKRLQETIRERLQREEKNNGHGNNSLSRITGDITDSKSLGRDSYETVDSFSFTEGEPRFVNSCSRDLSGWWEIEPELGRVANGIPNRVDRLKGLGNAQVPVVAALAFYLLMRRFCE